MNIPGIAIKIETDKFPVLEGEEDEIVNEGMYGKAICLYLSTSLKREGYEVPAFFPEDWGWWLDVVSEDFVMGLCIYSDPDAGQEANSYTIMSSITQAKKWSWSKFGYVDESASVIKVMDSVEKIFREDSEIRSIERGDDL